MMYRSRKAFSLLTAIFLIIIMASVGMFVMNLSGKMVQGTTVQFQREQATLLAKSYTELAIMTVMANNRTANACIDAINSDAVAGNTASILPPTAAAGDPGGYRARVNIGYIGQAGEIGGCANQLGNPSAGVNTLNIMVDTYIEYQDFTDPRFGTADAKWITYHRRTLQKI